ncbi:unnamed protein product [Protopolystoma xenopodis]|uniref:Uncharacterized protein n=1 Tax=Protopolystoma xenopodis TaxID=117903 RepID=A0A3S5AB13_9PLAT|nr:unnamed protein product [Protopolystoma xenopodis]
MARLTDDADYDASEKFENVPSPLSDALSYDNYYDGRLRTRNAAYDAGETFGNVPSQWTNAENHEYYGTGHGTRHIPQPLPDALIKLQNKV